MEGGSLHEHPWYFQSLWVTLGRRSDPESLGLWEQSTLECSSMQIGQGPGDFPWKQTVGILVLFSPPDHSHSTLDTPGDPQACMDIRSLSELQQFPFPCSPAPFYLSKRLLSGPETKGKLEKFFI